MYKLLFLTLLFTMFTCKKKPKTSLPHAPNNFKAWRVYNLPLDTIRMWGSNEFGEKGIESGLTSVTMHELDSVVALDSLLHSEDSIQNTLVHNPLSKF